MLATHRPPSVALGAKYGYDTGFGGCWKNWAEDSCALEAGVSLAGGLTELLRKTKDMGNLLAL